MTHLECQIIMKINKYKNNGVIGYFKIALFVLERFMESSVSFDDFAKEPTQILSNPKLVFRIDDRYNISRMSDE